MGPAGRLDCWQAEHDPWWVKGRQLAGGREQLLHQLQFLQPEPQPAGARTCAWLSRWHLAAPEPGLHGSSLNCWQALSSELLALTPAVWEACSPSQPAHHAGRQLLSSFSSLFLH